VTAALQYRPSNYFSFFVYLIFLSPSVLKFQVTRVLPKKTLSIARLLEGNFVSQEVATPTQATLVAWCMYSADAIIVLGSKMGKENLLGFPGADAVAAVAAAYVLQLTPSRGLSRRPSGLPACRPAAGAVSQIVSPYSHSII